jgi:hypothetical protein
VKKFGAMIVCALAFAASGCTTTFYGSAKIEGGRAQCETTCKQWDMDLVGMVAVGEYTNGCICQARSSSSSVSVRDIGQTVLLGSAGTAAGTVGAYNAMKSGEAGAAAASFGGGIGGF